MVWLVEDSGSMKGGAHKKASKGKKPTSVRALTKKLALERKKTMKAKMAARKAVSADKTLKRVYHKRLKNLRHKTERAEARMKRSDKGAKGAKKKLKKLQKKGKAAQKKVKRTPVSLAKLKKKKAAADALYDKLKRQHALSGVGLKLKQRRKKGLSHFAKPFGISKMSSLRKAANAKNVIDLQYKKEVGKEIRRQQKLNKLSKEARGNKAVPSVHSIEKAGRRDKKGIAAESKMMKLRSQGLAKIAKADAKAQRRIRRETQLAMQVKGLQERAAKKARKVKRVMERTKKDQLKKSAKKSAWRRIKADTRNAEYQARADQLEFMVSDKARRIRAAKARIHAATVRRKTIEHTFRVIKAIDAAAKRSSKIIAQYHKRQHREKTAIQKALAKGQKKLAVAQAAIKETTKPLRKMLIKKP